MISCDILSCDFTTTERLSVKILVSMSLGSIIPYPTAPSSIVAKRISDVGGKLDYHLKICLIIRISVYVIAAFGNDGDGGLQTPSDPSISPGVMAIASANNGYFPLRFIMSPNGAKIFVLTEDPRGRWNSRFDFSIIGTTTANDIIRSRSTP